jgi:hypothetical protein
VNGEAFFDALLPILMIKYSSVLTFFDIGCWGNFHNHIFYKRHAHCCPHKSYIDWTLFVVPGQQEIVKQLWLFVAGKRATRNFTSS